MTRPADPSDDVLLYVGVIGRLDTAVTRLTIRWTDDGAPRTADVAIVQATSVTREGVAVARTQLRVGERVTVIAAFNDIEPGEIPEASDIMLGTLTGWRAPWL